MTRERYVALQEVMRANAKLREARDLLKSAGARKATESVRRAIRSAGGALRHAQGQLDREYYAARRVEELIDRERIVVARGR